MESKKIIIAEILVLVALTQLASAISIEIEGKDSFGLGDEISFTYTLLSEVTQEVEYLAVASCPSAPLSLLEIKNTTLKANIPFTESYIYLSSVSENIEAQRCNISVAILDPETVVRKSFNILMIPSFDFDALTCKDSTCDLKVKVFILDEDVYLNYVSNMSNVDAIVVLIRPDGTTEELSLPYAIKADQVGTYNLKVMASLVGYKDVVKEIQFGVIENEMTIPYSQVRDAGISKEEEIEDVSSFMTYIYLTILVVLILGLVFLVRSLIKSKHRKKHKAHVSKEYT